MDTPTARRLRKCRTHENCTEEWEGTTITHRPRGANVRRFEEWPPTHTEWERGLDDGLMLDLFRRFEESRLKDLEARVQQMERRFARMKKTLEDRIDEEVRARISHVKKHTHDG